MKIAVCVKQIPDPATPYELDPETHFVVRPEDQVLDDTDRYGVEVGLQLANANEGTVTLFSMSPSGSGSTKVTSTAAFVASRVLAEQTGIDAGFDLYSCPAEDDPGLGERGYLETSSPLRIRPAQRGSGQKDLSIAHDRYIASK